MQMLATFCPGLLELDVSDCKQITSEGLLVLLQSLQNLEVLSCRRIPGIDPAILK